jgi:septal ring factor EnvC (AmiA/AmiB activator)
MINKSAKSLIFVFLFQALLFSQNHDVDKIKKRLEELRGKELSELEEIERIDYEIFLIEREIDGLKAKEKLFSELLKNKEMELEKIKEDFEKEEKKLKEVFSAIYMFKYINPIQIFLSNPKNLTFSDISRIIYLSNLRKDRIHQLNLAYRKVLSKEQELKKASEDYQKTIKSKESKLSVLNLKKKEKKKIIENLRKEKNRYIKILEEIEKSSHKITEKIQEIEPEKYSDNLTSIRERKGLLPWPIKGKIIQRFGLIKNKKYNTVVKNIGIVLSPEEEEVRAIWWGKVIFADYFEGYGNVVIIEHQDRIYSIYGYLGTILVGKGERVKMGQTIAKIGSTGLAEEKALYFEIREGNEPKNPLLWLSNK